VERGSHVRTGSPAGDVNGDERQKRSPSADNSNIVSSPRALPEWPMISHLYRFRRADAVLDKYEELSRQEIYFSPPEELNDPMEGYKECRAENRTDFEFHEVQYSRQERRFKIVALPLIRFQ